MKTRFFVFLAATLVVMAINAEQIGWNEYDVTSSSGLDDVSFSDGEFELVITDTQSKFVIDASNAYFGDAESQTQFTHRLKTGSPSSSGNYFVLEIPRAGKLYMYARCASSSATDRHIIMRANGIEVFNQIVKESDAIQVPGLDETNPETLTKVYPVHVIDVDAGTLVVTYPNGSMNFYGFCLDSQYVPTCEVKIGDLNYYLNSDKTAVVVYGDGWPDDNYSGLTTANIQSSIVYKSVTYTVTGIGREAFRDCSSLTSVIIPNSVTSIGWGAFGNCGSLASVTLPDGVISIGDYAFADCSGLTFITIPNSVESIGEGAFGNCSNLAAINVLENNQFYSSGDGVLFDKNKTELIQFPKSSPITSYNIPNSVISIRDRAFYESTGLTSVTIGNSVTSIGNDAFEGCTGLTSVTWNAINYPDLKYANMPFGTSITSFAFGNDVEHIPAFLCYGMSQLDTINIPNSVTSIGEGAFSHCTGLTSVIIGNSVTNIGRNAFNSCTGLTSIEIPNSVTSIGRNAFSCGSLISVLWNVKKCADFDFDTAPFDYNTSLNSFAFGENVKKIPAYLCYNMNRLEEITIPYSVTSISKKAFKGCSGLRKITLNSDSIVAKVGLSMSSYFGTQIEEYVLGDSIKCIGNNAFSGCTGMTLVNIPNSIDSIGDYAFFGCSGLTAIIIPNSVTSIGEFAFCGCTGLSSIEIPNSVETIYGGAFSGCTGVTFVSLGSNVSTLKSHWDYHDNTYTYVFDGCNSVTSVVWNAKKCNGYNFGSQVESFIFGEEVEEIPSDICKNMNKLTSVTIPNSATYIRFSAFNGCAGLTSVSIGSNVMGIGSDAFRNCSSLTSVTIPNYVESIGTWAFGSCANLTSVYIQAETPPSLGNNAFYKYYDNNPLESIFVPCGTLNTYKKSSNWSSYASIIKYQPLLYTITTNAQNGSIKIEPDELNACSDITLTAIPNEGYHFTQWSDGNIDNPRAIVLTKDTTFTAEFSNIDPTGIDNLIIYNSSDKSNVPTRKLLRNGQIFILRGNKTYTTDGRLVR